MKHLLPMLRRGPLFFLCFLSAAVRAQSLETGTVYPQAFCPGASTAIPFTATGTFGANNVFAAQLSDAMGSFASPVTIGTFAGTLSNAVPVVIPLSTSPGTGYRVRVVSSDPVLIAGASPVALTVRGQATFNNPGTVNACQGSPVALAFTGTASWFNWSINNTAIGLGLPATGVDGLNFIANNSGNAVASATVQVLPNGGSRGSIYLSGFDNGAPTLFEVNAATNTVRRKVVFSRQTDVMIRDVVVSPDGGRIFVLTQDKLYVSDSTSLTPVPTGLSGANTYSFTVSADGSIIYLGEFNSVVRAVRTSDLSVVKIYDINSDALVNGIRVSPDGRRLYVVYANADGIHSDEMVQPFAAFDVLTGAVLFQHQIQGDFPNLTLSPNGTRAYLFSARSVLIYNALTGAETGRIEAEYWGYGTLETFESMVPSPDGKRFYVAEGSHKVIRAYDSESNQLLATIPAEMPWSAPDALGISQDGRMLYGTDNVYGLLHIYDIGLGGQVATVPINQVLMYSDRFVFSAPVSCSAGSSESFTLAVYPKPSATISYGNVGAFCTSGGSAPVTRTGTAGGRYWASSPSLSIDDATGSINLAASAPGTYTVFYRAGNPVCDSVTATTSVQVFAAVATSISYPGSPYCSSTGTGSVFFSGHNGGTFSAAPSGLSLNAVTGAIDIAASQAGNYTVTYTASNGACAIVATAPVSIRPNPGAVTDNRTFCGGTTTTPIGFGAASGLSYAWTNDNPAIGLSASGNGPVPAFAAVNDGAGNAYANIRISASGGTGCDLKQASFRITVKPKPSVGAIADQTLCAGSLSAPVTFAGNVAGTIYSWTNSNASIGLAAAGTGNIASFYAVNNSAAPGNVTTGTVMVTPSAQGCTGDPRTFAITVRPSAGTLAYNGSPFCPSGTAYPTLHGSSGGTYSVVGSGLSIDAASGVINLAASAPGTYVVQYIRPAGSCNNVAPATVVIKPRAEAVAIPNQVFCAGTAVAALPFGGTFSWTNTNATIGLPASGTGSALPAFTALNSGNVPQYAQVNVTPTGDANSCPGRITAFRIAVNPTPSVNAVAEYNDTFCRMSAVPAVTFTGPVAGTTYNWTASSLASGIGALRGTGGIGLFVAANPTSGLLTTTITVQPVANKCAGPVRTLSLYVDDCDFLPGPPPDRDRHAGVTAADFTLSPNPATGPVVLRYSGQLAGTFRVQLVNQYGQVSNRSWQLNGATATLDLSGVVPGNYLLLITNQSTGAAVQKLLVKL